MNTVITSREAILAASMELAAAEGLQKLNMRAVAAACHVAVGSVYNYFPSKADLVAATVEEIWKGIFHNTGDCQLAKDFLSSVAWLFDSIKKGADSYPAFFSIHANGFTGSEKEAGRQVMEAYFGHMKRGMLQMLDDDSGVRADAFDEAFTKEDCVGFVFHCILGLLGRNESDCNVLIQVVKRIIY